MSFGPQERTELAPESLGEESGLRRVAVEGSPRG